MALEWVILSYVAAAEATMVLLLTLPAGLNPLRKGVTTVIRNILKPLLSVVPFCLFLLLDIYWKYDSRPKCGESSSCTPSELMRHQKSTIKSERNALLIGAALMFYWMLFAFTRLALQEDLLNDRLARLKNHVDSDTTTATTVTNDNLLHED